MNTFKDLFDLSGRTAVVTGACGILGRRFSAALAEFGANVAVVDLDQKECDELATELRSQYGVKAAGISCDVSDPVTVDAMVERAVSELGPIQILHNNAATKSEDLSAFFAAFEDYSLQEWRKIMAVNLDGMFLVAQGVGRHMVKAGIKGSIIQTASIYGVLAPDQRIYEGSEYLGTQINTPGVYSASKAGVVGLSKYLAAYWAGHGIRVNTLTPGGVRSGQNDVFVKNYSARVPLGRMGEPDEIAAALIFLASDASTYMTGQNLIIDGGLSAW